MTDETVHPESEIQELVDGRLSVERRAEVERHIAGCGQCHRLRDALAFVRDSVRASLPAAGVPGDVVIGVKTALDRVARRTTSSRSVETVAAPRRFGRVAALVGLAAALAVAVLLLVSRESSLPAAAARDFDRVQTGRLVPAFPTDNPGSMEAYFVRKGLRFRTRVFDLAMMGYRLEGGTVHALSGRPSALFVYRGADGRLLVCEMYEGRTSELPPPAETRRHGEFEFFIYRRGDRTAVFWQEGAVTCVLIGEGAPEDVIQLAFAKAMKAS